MTNSLISQFRAATALVVLFSASSCLTTRVINRAYDRYPTSANIKRIAEAATLDEHLYLLLDVESAKFKSSSTVLLKIPLDDIGSGHDSSAATSFAHDGLQLRAPYVGAFEATTTIPVGARPLPIHNVPNDPTKDPDDLELDMQDWIYSRPPGVYVMIVPYFMEDTETKKKAAALPPGTIPRNGYLLVVRRDAHHAPRQQRMWGFSEYLDKRYGLLFLTPLTVVADIVTFPFQLLYLLGD